MDFDNINNSAFGSDFSNMMPDRAELEAEESFAQADKILNDGVIMEAVEKLMQILRRNPRFGKAHNHLDRVSKIPGIAKETIANEYAITYEMQGNLQEAMDYYQKAAIVTLDTGKLDKYKESIDRCKKKLEILNPSGGFYKLK